jgi:hypothetical protein
MCFACHWRNPAGQSRAGSESGSLQLRPQACARCRLPKDKLTASSMAGMAAHTVTPMPRPPCRASVSALPAALASAAAAVPALQVVATEGAALRLPHSVHSRHSMQGMHSGHSVATFGEDMPAPVPLARWDRERLAAPGGGGGSGGAELPPRFGGFLPSEWVGVGGPGPVQQSISGCAMKASRLQLGPAQQRPWQAPEPEWWLRAGMHTRRNSMKPGAEPRSLAHTVSPRLPADVAGFDGGLFGVGAAEASLLDPAQRLLLEVAWEAVGSARGRGGGGGAAAPRPASPPRRPRGGRAGPAPQPDVGVYVGASHSEWAALLQAHGRGGSGFAASGSGLSVLAGGHADAAAHPGRRPACWRCPGCAVAVLLPLPRRRDEHASCCLPPAPCTQRLAHALLLSFSLCHKPPIVHYSQPRFARDSCAGRLSFVFGWSGPAAVTDTACSSSLVALSTARASLMVGWGRACARFFTFCMW